MFLFKKNRYVYLPKKKLWSIFLEVCENDDDSQDYNITLGQACTSKNQGIYSFYLNQMLFFYQILTLIIKHCSSSLCFNILLLFFQNPHMRMTTLFKKSNHG